jgi:alkylation response protein AidB-like acyl-CoA dehydrogenase
VIPLTATTPADSRQHEIRQLRQAVRRSVRGSSPQGSPAPDPAWRQTWSQLCEIGIVGMCVPENHGGFGMRADAAVAIAAELGAALHGSPYPGLVAAAHALGTTGENSELLEAVLSGERICAFGHLDRDGATARLVDGAAEADVLLLTSPDGLLLVEKWQAAQPYTFDVSRSCGDVRIAVTAGRHLPHQPLATSLFRLLLAADAVGCVDRMLDSTVAYAKTREAFGKAIGGYQAVQHRLVDHGVKARGMSLAVEQAARALSENAPDADRLISLAELSVSSGATHLVHDLVQLTGGIGFTWEYGLHFFDRRVHQDARLARNPRSAARRVAEVEGWSGSSVPAASRPEATTDSEIDAYRAQIRAFIAQHGLLMDREGVRAPTTPAEEQQIRSWLRSLYDAGYLGAGWPVEWGGRADHLPVHDLVLMEELILGDAYRPLDQVMLAAHAIVEFGTDEQKSRYLPRIRGGEHVWCQLFSEPEAGSDLASLRTRAEIDGDSFVITGQKIWSTDAQWADMGLLLARTDPTQRHGGITAFVVPMDLPGIEVRPIREMTGHAEFCEVFLDGVRLGPEHVLGEVNGGWTVVSSGLASERAFVGANAVQLQRMFDDLVILARGARDDDGSAAIEHEDVRAELAGALARVHEVKLIVRDTVERILVDAEHPSDGPLAKLAYSETNVSLCETALGILSSAATIDQAARPVADRWQHNFLWSRALTISGGASEILRGLIGRQLYGLPRA